MSVLLIALLAGVGFIVAYHTYGRWLGEKIFRLSAGVSCPSERLNDGVDYVPTRKSVVFGHHFTSIAGTGPIVGPAIAIMWGWLPALLWVLFGSIFIGAVHDFASLVVSLRNNGQTIGDVAGRLLNRRVRLLFLLLLFLALTIVIAIFGLVIAAVFKQYPAAIFPSVVQIPLAIAIGIWLHRRNVHLLLPSLLALGLMYLSVIFGNAGPLGTLNAAMAAWPIWVWVVVLLTYAFWASVLPVWSLLQPRDYINSLQLITSLALIGLGLVAAVVIGGPMLASGERVPLEFAAPMVQWKPAGAPLIFPFLFITIACGAISGFHCLVSSGTSSKQIRCERDARLIGFGAMLTEGFMATLVILACGAGLGLGIVLADGTALVGQEAWAARYGSWAAAGGLATMVAAFVDGAANFLAALGIPAAVGVALMGVFVASFAGTTLDTACRLQRYVVQELATGVREKFDQGRGLPLPAIDWATNRYGATLVAVVTGAMLAALPPPALPWSLENAGRGGLILWPLFGATNQLLAGLAFLVVAFYLWRRKLPVFFVVPPMIFMLIMPFWAMTWQIFIGSEGHPSWLSSGNWVLVSIGVTTLVLEIWMIIEAIRLFPQARGMLETPPAATVEPAEALQ
jgi:carbon starvation protein